MSAEVNNQGMLDAALEIAARRRAILLQLKAAKRNNDIPEVYRLIDELVPESATSNVISFPRSTE